MELGGKRDWNPSFLAPTEEQGLCSFCAQWLERGQMRGEGAGPPARLLHAAGYFHCCWEERGAREAPPTPAPSGGPVGKGQGPPGFLPLALVTLGVCTMLEAH